FKAPVRRTLRERLMALKAATLWSWCLRPAERVKDPAKWWYPGRAKLVAAAEYRSPKPGTGLRCSQGQFLPIRFPPFARRAYHSFSCWVAPQEAPAEAPHLQALRAADRSV